MQMLATADQMRDFDRIAIRSCGIPGLVLMENAGRAFVQELEKLVGDLSGKSIIVMCGKGNNGGDGFVIARHLINRNASVQVVLLCPRKEVKGDAKTNLDILFKMRNEPALKVIEVKSARGLDNLQSAEIIVDALFGTGFSGKVKGIQQKAIQWINGQKSFIASVDIASGVDASTGRVENFAVKAHSTVTMGLAKVGHFVGAGREHSGEITIADISIPRAIVRPAARQIYRVTAEDVAQALPKRPLTAHKYSVGKIFVLAGSRGLTGAPYMCSQAAMRAGAGGVILGVPKSIYSPLVRKLTEVMVTPLEETADGSAAETSRDVINEKIEWADVVILGPGLSRNTETQRLLLHLIPNIRKPLVLDADGLNCVAKDISVLLGRKHPTILTPHIGELSRLLRMNARELELNRVAIAREASDALKSIVVVKGSPSITGTPNGPSYINSTGNPGMATAGAGDVLTGIIAGLVGQRMSSAQAAFCGVYIHGLAGDMAATRYGQRSLMALDILEETHNAIRSLET